MPPDLVPLWEHRSFSFAITTYLSFCLNLEDRVGKEEDMTQWRGQVLWKGKEDSPLAWRNSGRRRCYWWRSCSRCFLVLIGQQLGLGYCPRYRKRTVNSGKTAEWLISKELQYTSRGVAQGRNVCVVAVRLEVLLPNKVGLLGAVNLRPSLCAS